MSVGNTRGLIVVRVSCENESPFTMHKKLFSTGKAVEMNMTSFRKLAFMRL